MADFNNPLSTQGYAALLASIVENNQAALLMLEGVAVLANLPANAKRWNVTNKRFEYWTGSAWLELAALFEMKVRNSDQLNGYTEASFRDAGLLSSGIIAAARFADSTHGSRSGGSLHALCSGAAHGFMSATDFSKLAGIESGATADQTAAEILAALLTVDGTGTGLDADLLDGAHLASILARANHTGTQPMSTISNAGALATLNEATEAYFPAITAGLTYMHQYQGATAVNPGSSSNVQLTAAGNIGWNRFAVPRSGTYRFSVDLASAAGGYAVYARVYSNGVAVGTDMSNNTTSFVTKTVDIAVNAGDYIDLYGRLQAGLNVGSIKNFKMSSATKLLG